MFAVCDILMGLILWALIDSYNKNNKDRTIYYVAFWLCNPLTINISTRGSNDIMISMLVFAALYFILKKQYVIAGVFFGLSVHFKLYPIIYSIVFYFFIDCNKELIRSGKKCQALFTNFFTVNRIVFTLVSALTFIGLTAYFYHVYGYEFIYETYLYHFERKDNRHNYSVYWYMIY